MGQPEYNMTFVNVFWNVFCMDLLARDVLVNSHLKGVFQTQKCNANSIQAIALGQRVTAV